VEETKLRIEEDSISKNQVREFDLDVDDLESAGYESADDNNNDQ